MNLKRNGEGWDVYVGGLAIGQVRKVPQNPAYGRGAGPISSDVLVWGPFTADGRRLHPNGYSTRKAAAEAVSDFYHRQKSKLTTL